MKELIYNQRRIPAQALRYGLRPSSQVGCGWIAIYNALVLLGCQVDPQALIRRCESQLPLIHGNLGTTLWAPAQILKSLGFPTTLEFRRERFDQAAREAPVSILFYRWRKGPRIGAHFVALHCQKGVFTGYNTYTNSTGPDVYGPSLEAFLKEKGYFGAVLTTVGPRRKPSPAPGGTPPEIP